MSKALAGVWASLNQDQRQAFLPHLVGDTSPEWLARTLTEAGYRIGQTTIKAYRRALREDGVQV